MPGAVRRMGRVMSRPAFPVVRRPGPGASRPVVVSIPHFGTEPIPDVRPEDYADPQFVHLPWGYADTFAAEVYGQAHNHGATVVATPYSRLFVDVNRRRDDFTRKNGVVTSAGGVFRTHTRRGRPIFAEPMTEARAEGVLAAYYDPFHAALGGALDDLRNRHGRVLLLDSHTASPNRMGEREVVLGTRGGATADRAVVDRIADLVAAVGVDVREDVPGYAGGHIVRRYGEDGPPDVDAVQIEINAGFLMTTPREELVPRMIRGERPGRHAENIARMRRCVGTIVKEALGRLATP